MASAGAAFDKLAAEGMLKGEMIGIAAALVILVIVFGALVASGLPLMVGGVSIVAAVGATAVVGQVFELSFFIVNMITMMGLALGIDYSLIIVQRFREELAHGRTVRDAVAVAGDTASRAVFFSALAVLVSLAGMLVVPFTVMVSLGAGAIIVAIMAMIAALTLLPAVLSLLGHKVGAGRLPFSRPGSTPRMWSAIARGVMKRPLVGVIAGAGVLLAVAVPALSMRMAFTSVDALPQDLAYRQAVETLSAEFGYGEAETLVAVSDAGNARGQIESLAADHEANPAFADVTVEWVGENAFIDIKDAYDPSEVRAEEAIRDLRDTVIPQHLEGTGAKAFVGGEVADTLDFNAVMTDSAP
jgi:RND superfamily putative drug exporter